MDPPQESISGLLLLLVSDKHSVVVRQALIQQPPLDAVGHDRIADSSFLQVPADPSTVWRFLGQFKGNRLFLHMKRWYIARVLSA